MGPFWDTVYVTVKSLRFFLLWFDIFRQEVCTTIYIPSNVMTGISVSSKSSKITCTWSFVTDLIGGVCSIPTPPNCFLERWYFATDRWEEACVQHQCYNPIINHQSTYGTTECHELREYLLLSDLAAHRTQRDCPQHSAQKPSCRPALRSPHTYCSNHLSKQQEHHHITTTRWEVTF